MPSTFTWLDYSEQDRRRAIAVIDMFREKQTVDELGIGTVRDALSNLLFPGTSTIQTRPKYFLLVPWGLQHAQPWAERKRPSLDELAARVRNDEVAVRNALVKAGERDGVIGYSAGASLQRMPSSVYWNGLDAWGIRRFPGSMRQLLRLLRLGAPESPLAEVDGDDPVSVADGYWHQGLPPIPRGFPAVESLDLTSEEAGYLQDRICTKVPGTLLAWLVRHSRANDPGDWPWAHPQVGELSPQLAGQVEHARCFSELMHGAALVYNLMLAGLIANRELIDVYEHEVDEWAGAIASRSSHHRGWDRQWFWRMVLDENPRIPHPTRWFVERWVGIVLGAGDVGSAVRSPETRLLIQNRELQLKRGKARLVNRRALEMWNYASGTRPINFRWSVVSTIVRDIRRGLGEEEVDAGS